MPRFIYANIEEGVFKATAQIEKYDAATQEKIKAAIKNGTTAVFEQAVRNAPMSATGNLKKGIKMETNTNYSYASGIVKSTAPHSHLVEFGTRRRIVYPVRRKAMVINGHFVKGYVNNGAMPKKPFLRPAIDKERPGIEESIKKVLQ
ncbi:HK97-gp10 family putative phage morphogenesis protein [Pectinatus frisingensis]|uniref:HK97-gp10 family putative phage morphogenesis protein n=1 Tax=Pectinatus frisingensis TaxID=865 RepID=UPI0018C5EFE5|nr:HK97-gp10 family putative phage morphogenesis protein [Pectinatus frisingensis]